MLRASATYWLLAMLMMSSLLATALASFEVDEGSVVAESGGGMMELDEEEELDEIELAPMDDSVLHKYVPSADAVQQIHVSLGRDETQMIVMWVTSSNSKSSVRYGTTRGGSKSNQVDSDIKPSTYSMGSYRSGYIHTTVLTGLKASTTYYYNCGSTSAWSAEFSFTTAPPLGTKEVTVAIAGDVGTSSAAKKVFQNVAKDSKNQMFWLVGDLSYADNTEARWDTFGNLIQSTIANVPFMSLPGNHEKLNPSKTFTPFTTRFNIPLISSYTGDSGGMYFSYNYGSIHFISLDSENSYTTSSKQYRWLQADLKAIDRTVTPWVIVGFHRPWYCSNKSHQGEGAKMKAAMEALLYSFQVDLCISGHVHAYERTVPVYKDKPTSNGLVHITIGTGGIGLTRSWNSTPQWSAVRNSNEWGFGQLRIYNNGASAEWRVVSNSGKTVDSFVLPKRQRNVPLVMPDNDE